MRLWSLDPALLDRRALVAGWREALLAQKVLAGGTRGYTHHPQLTRFRAVAQPGGAIGTYLTGLADAAEERGYAFNRSLILAGAGTPTRLTVTTGQLDHEWAHLRAKVAVRDAQWDREVLASAKPGPHPMFDVVEGPVEPWERP